MFLLVANIWNFTNNEYPDNKACIDYCHLLKSLHWKSFSLSAI